MATNFPGSVDSFPRPTSTTNTDDPGFELDVVIDNLSDALEAVETRVLAGGGSWAVAAPPDVDGYHFTVKPTITAAGANQNWLIPVAMKLAQRTYTRIGCLVATADAGAVIRFGIYERLASGASGNLLVDAGTVTAASTGPALATINFTPTSPDVYVCMVIQSARTTLAIRGTDLGFSSPPNGLIEPNTGGAGALYGPTTVTGALPTTITVTNVGANVVNIPTLVLR